MIITLVSRAAEALSTGSINAHSLFSLPAVPAIVAEWSCLLPLVCHLASYSYSRRIVGDLALRGELAVSLFPRLGVLLGIARLLSNNGSFLDEASSMGKPSDTVFDVNYGSVFPCANGEASRILTRHAISRAGPPIRLPDSPPPHDLLSGQRTLNSASTTSMEFSDHLQLGTVNNSQISCIQPTETQFRRYQNLHVLYFSSYYGCKRKPRWLKSFFTSCVLPCATNIALLASIAILLLMGAYGTAIIIFISLLLSALCRISKLRIQRPHGYLHNNESGNACMLVAIHQNANEWHLYLGDRGIIDSLLNKTMISFVGPPKLLSSCFHIAHTAQLLTMTYVAAQKGFDGIFLLFLMVLSSLTEWAFGDDFLARQWLRQENVCVSARSFQFTGRRPLIGTVQMCGNNNESSWMDSIIAKNPRREAWLECLGTKKVETEVVATHGLEKSTSSNVDPLWLELNVSLARQGYDIVTKELSSILSKASPLV